MDGATNAVGRRMVREGGANGVGLTILVATGLPDASVTTAIGMAVLEMNDSRVVDPAGGTNVAVKMAVVNAVANGSTVAGATANPEMSAARAADAMAAIGMAVPEMSDSPAGGLMATADLVANALGEEAMVVIGMAAPKECGSPAADLASVVNAAMGLVNSVASALPVADEADGVTAAVTGTVANAAGRVNRGGAERTAVRLGAEAKRGLPAEDSSPDHGAIAAFHAALKTIVTDPAANRVARNLKCLRVDRADSIARWSARVLCLAARNLAGHSLADSNPVSCHNPLTHLRQGTARSSSARLARLRVPALFSRVPAKHRLQNRNRQKVRSRSRSDLPITSGQWPSSRM
jgi:hypothetical protein